MHTVRHVEMGMCPRLDPMSHPHSEACGDGDVSQAGPHGPY